MPHIKLIVAKLYTRLTHVKRIANITEAIKDLELVQNFKNPAVRGTLIRGAQKLPDSHSNSIIPFSRRERRTARPATPKVESLAMVIACFSVRVLIF
ncbi:MAG: hypothetical protein MRQ09_05605 [Candidatus Midichloria sp.]|nr:hypothetical protein [Candidatus Midichloria sp.]